MAYTYTPTYYSSLHDSITTLCKSVIPFSVKKLKLPAGSSDQKRLKQQSTNLKWQQDSFHHILNLMGLCREGILAETEVSSFRSRLIDTIIAASADQEPPVILRDKLLFLQELLYAKCISVDEYHASKRPLLQRLAVQGAEIEARDVILSPREGETEEWTVIDLNEKENSNPENKVKGKKRYKGSSSSIFSFMSSYRNGKPSEKMKVGEKERGSILMQECKNPVDGDGRDHTQKRFFRSVFQKEETPRKPWQKGKNEEDESATPLNDISNDQLVSGFSRSIGEGPDTKRIKRKLHPDGNASDFFVDKVLGEKIKRELSKIQKELSSSNPNLQFSKDQIEAISTKLPVDKTDLKSYFPKAWCDRYGDLVLNVVKKEFKDHVREMESHRKKRNSSSRWATFDNNNDQNIGNG